MIKKIFFNFTFVISILFNSAVSYPKEYVMSYQYNDKGLLDSTIYPTGTTIRNNYNDHGRFNSVEMHKGAAMLAKVRVNKYNEMGNIERLSYDTDGSPLIYYVYDSIGRLNYLALSRVAGSQREMLYRIHDIKYNSQGYKSSFRRSDVSFNETYSFDYTSQGHLETFQLGNQSRFYSYDQMGNMTHASAFSIAEKNIDIPGLSAQYDTTTNHSSDYVYDEQGRVEVDEDYFYAYYPSGQIKEVRDKVTNEWVEFYIYDPAGSRLMVVRQQEATLEVEDLAGRSALLYKYDPFGSQKQRDEYMNVVHGQVYRAEYDEADTQIIGEYRGHDERGNPVVIIDQATGSLEKNEYMPFGEPLYLDQQLQPSEGFAQMEEDQTGLIYMGARFYNKIGKRFTTPDPARDFSLDKPASINLYQYARNNPISLHDPTGLVADPNSEEDDQSGEGTQASIDEANRELERKIEEYLQSLGYENASVMVVTGFGESKNMILKRIMQDYYKKRDTLGAEILFGELPIVGSVLSSMASLFINRGVDMSEAKQGDVLIVLAEETSVDGGEYSTFHIIRNISDGSTIVHSTKDPTLSLEGPGAGMPTVVDLANSSKVNDFKSKPYKQSKDDRLEKGAVLSFDKTVKDLIDIRIVPQHEGLKDKATKKLEKMKKQRDTVTYAGVGSGGDK